MKEIRTNLIRIYGQFHFFLYKRLKWVTGFIIYYLGVAGEAHIYKNSAVDLYLSNVCMSGFRVL